MAEGTPLERVQVVDSGARVQIPPSPLAFERTHEERLQRSSSVVNSEGIYYKVP